MLKTLLDRWYDHRNDNSEQPNKVLLFSYSKRMLDILEKFLIRIDHKFIRYAVLYVPEHKISGMQAGQLCEHVQRQKRFCSMNTRTYTVSSSTEGACKYTT